VSSVTLTINNTLKDSSDTSPLNMLTTTTGFRNWRYLTQTAFLSFGTILIIALALIGLLFVQLVGSHVATRKTIFSHPSGCLNGSIQWIPFALPLAPRLISRFIWPLWHIDDIYGVRHEVIASVCS
jgi:hypothetical protein